MMEPAKPTDAASEALPAGTPLSPAPADGSADAPRTRRLSPKLLMVAGAAVLALGLGSGAAVMLWPKAPDPVQAKAAKAKKKADSATLASAPASAPMAASAAAAASAPTETEPGAAVALAAAPHDDGVRTVAMSAARPAAATHSHAASQSAEPAQLAAEEPIDRLRRRLGEVINGKGQLDAVASGDLRLRTRATPEVALTATGHRSAGPAATATAPQAHRPAAVPDAGHWAYEGKTGPQAWGRLKAEYATCAGGQRQSPIDIRDGIGLELEPLQFDYRSGSFAVIDNGHTVQVNVPPGNSLEVMGRRYELLQFHFHRPSEEHIDGRRFELSVHLVHKDAQGRLAVLAVLLERGAAQPLLQTVWNHLPLEKNEEVAVRAPIDLGQLLPENRRYFTYMGSLTTPPCSEGVLWLVLQQPVQLSQQQIDIFAHLYPMNARPLQQAAGRLIKQSH